MSARNPDVKSYMDKPWAKHYKSHHTGCTEPKIDMKIVARASTTNERKIKEARVIFKNTCLRLVRVRVSVRVMVKVKVRFRVHKNSGLGL